MKAFYVISDSEFIALGYYAAATPSQARYLGWRDFEAEFGAVEVGTFGEAQGYIRAFRCPKLDGFCGEEKGILHRGYCEDNKVPDSTMQELGLMIKATGEEGEPETDDGYLYNAKGNEGEKNENI